MGNSEIAKKYLAQAYFLDKRIESKIDQLQELRNLAEKVTSVISDVSVQSSHNGQRMQDAVVNIVSLEEDVAKEATELVLLKRNIKDLVNAIQDDECKLVLEKRYICYKNWQDIADEMEYTKARVYQIHKKALELVEFPKSL